MSNLPLTTLEPSEDVFGIAFWAGSNDAAANSLYNWLECRDYFNLSFANPEFLLTAERNAPLTAYLRQCRAVYADGAGILWASRVQGGRILERITGTDFQWRIFGIAAKLKLSVFLYGGLPEVAETAMKKIRESLPGLERIECCDGYLPQALAHQRIANFAPDIVMVCLGNPLQEEWIMRHGQQTGARLVFGNGGALDFISGRVRRAPAWVRNRGLEWLWRLGQDLTWTRIRRQAKLVRYLAKLIRLRIQN